MLETILIKIRQVLLKFVKVVKKHVVVLFGNIVKINLFIQYKCITFVPH